MLTLENSFYGCCGLAVDIESMRREGSRVYVCNVNVFEWFTKIPMAH